MRIAILPALALLALAACGSSDDTAPVDEMADGPVDAQETMTDEDCNYVESVFGADVVAVEDGQVELTGPDRASFYMQADKFETTPASGEKYTIKGQLIVEGTGTPEIYTVMDQAN
ncbi:MAG: hypothetical protein WA989_03300 [Henriciella sp.]|uniref:hypothetical protein n=1 Tax=Henriciella sp. TaxID=1968823 RepID=UPI003C71EBDE